MQRGRVARVPRAKAPADGQGRCPRRGRAQAFKLPEPNTLRNSGTERRYLMESNAWRPARRKTGREEAGGQPPAGCGPAQSTHVRPALSAGQGPSRVACTDDAGHCHGQGCGATPAPGRKCSTPPLAHEQSYPSRLKQKLPEGLPPHHLRVGFEPRRAAPAINLQRSSISSLEGCLAGVEGLEGRAQGTAPGRLKRV